MNQIGCAYSSIILMSYFFKISYAFPVISEKHENRLNRTGLQLCMSSNKFELLGVRGVRI